MTPASENHTVAHSPPLTCGQDLGLAPHPQYMVKLMGCHSPDYDIILDSILLVDSSVSHSGFEETGNHGGRPVWQGVEDNP